MRRGNEACILIYKKITESLKNRTKHHSCPPHPTPPKKQTKKPKTVLNCHVRMQFVLINEILAFCGLRSNVVLNSVHLSISANLLI